MDASDPRIAMVAEYRRQVEERRQTLVRRTRITLVVGGGLMALGGAGLALVGLATMIGANLGAGAAIALPGAILGITGVAMGVGGLALRRPEHLRDTGLPATAVYLGPGGGRGLTMSSGDGAEVGRWPLRFRVEVAGRDPYEVVVRDVVPMAAIPKLVPETRFPAFVDPRKPSRVLVDWPAA